MVKPNVGQGTFTLLEFTVNSRGHDDLFFYFWKGENNEKKYNIK